ncbi:hypothetical protein QJS04_geneDACA024760 [Acorus gramineus]|uniref:DUF7903 domain-containing protein n=1 Tax=Acorus gramineus TaxID=55184 RepID=A0AAV8ZZ06_ACOGR|nr:hypothetical protein QJS04_geneDACA024760 [Acorus gramineus]
MVLTCGLCWSKDLDFTYSEFVLSIQLIKSAIVDPPVKGGLRWPLGKESIGERFSVVGVWHTKFKAYKSLTMGLKIIQADRFDFLTNSGETTNEVNLKLKGIIGHLKVSLLISLRTLEK